ncbi:hypothetical protein ACWIGI_25430 [Nocardia sp. NPDC055321]
MTIEQNQLSFAEEFEALKAKHGEAYGDLRLVRFTDKEGQVGFRAFVPYSCRENSDGDIICEEDRPV